MATWAPETALPAVSLILPEICRTCCGLSGPRTVMVVVAASFSLFSEAVTCTRTDFVEPGSTPGAVSSAVNSRDSPGSMVTAGEQSRLQFIPPPLTWIRTLADWPGTSRLSLDTRYVIVVRSPEAMLVDDTPVMSTLGGAACAGDAATTSVPPTSAITAPA
jgi:hypothetical protein